LLPQFSDRGHVAIYPAIELHRHLAVQRQAHTFLRYCPSGIMCCASPTHISFQVSSKPGVCVKRLRNVMCFPANWQSRDEGQRLARRQPFSLVLPPCNDASSA
jgi:hypothetical protein